MFRSTTPLNFHSHDPQAPIISLTPTQYSDFVPAFPGQLVTVGIHPWDTIDDAMVDFNIISEAISDPRVIAIGEAGIDPLRGASLDRQQYLLHLQAKNAEAAGMPLVLHIVRRYDLLILLDDSLPHTVPWAVHAFRGNPAVVHLLADRDIYMSVGLRFNAEAVREIPDRLLLVETDDAPTTDIDLVVSAVALARNSSPTKIARLCRDNLARFFAQRHHF